MEVLRAHCTRALGHVSSPTLLRLPALWAMDRTAFHQKASVSAPSAAESTKVPSWLETVLEDRSAAPTLYSWTPENLGKQSRAPSSPSDHSRQNRIYIVGIGNLGRLYATSLASLPNAPPITLLLHRKQSLGVWADNPAIEITRQGRTERFTGFDAEWWSDEKPSQGPIREAANAGTISNLLVATKAPPALPEVDRLRRYLDKHSTVVFASNGMSKLWDPWGEVYNSCRFDSEHPNFLVSITSNGLYTIGDFKSVHAAHANTAIGPVCLNSKTRREADYLIKLLVSAPHLQATAFTRSETWVRQIDKLVVNSIINPLSAIFRCKNGEVFLDPNGEVTRVIDMLLQEMSSVLQTLVLDDSNRANFVEDVAGDDPAAIDEIRSRLYDGFSVSNLRAKVQEVARKTGENSCSMLQDVRAGRKTEIQEFNGWFVETASCFKEPLDMTGHKNLIRLVESGAEIERSSIGSFFPSKECK